MPLTRLMQLEVHTMLLTLHDISYSYPGSPEPVFSSVSATFPRGWTGIVGDNGSGKSTLLQIATGGLRGFSGNVTPVVSGVYCAQPTESMPPDVHGFACDYEPEAIRLRSILGIDEEWAWRFDTLSHGERKRLQIGVALWKAPPVLALDEPTNHIDATTRKRLLVALRSFSGIGLLVSHDREFLDTLVSQCLFFEGGRALMRPGTYTEGKKQADLERQTIASERKHAKAELSHLQLEKIRRSEQAGKADSRRSKRNIDPKDRSAKAKIDLAIFTGQDGQAGRLSSQMGSRLAAAEKRVQDARVEKRYEGDIWVDAHPARRKTLVHLGEARIPMGEKTLHHGDLYVGNTDRIGLWGRNGAGKSTLIRKLVDSLPADERDRVLYIPQELSRAEGARVLGDLKGLSREEQGRVLSAVAQLNSSPKRVLSGDALSPGELRKVMLAIGMMNDPNLIIMDEPTNHLDIHSIEALERVLAGCPCALVLVSHDARFLGALTDITWEFIEQPHDDPAQTHIELRATS